MNVDRHLSIKQVKESQSSDDCAESKVSVFLHSLACFRVLFVRSLSGNGYSLRRAASIKLSTNN